MKGELVLSKLLNGRARGRDRKRVLALRPMEVRRMAADLSPKHICGRTTTRYREHRGSRRGVHRTAYCPCISTGVTGNSHFVAVSVRSRTAYLENRRPVDVYSGRKALR